MDEMTVFTRSIERMTWDQLKKRVYNLLTPRDCFDFLMSYPMNQEELNFLIRRVKYIISTMEKEVITVSLLETTSLLVRFLNGKSNGDKLPQHIVDSINTLCVLKAEQTDNVETLYRLLDCTQGMRINNPIYRKIWLAEELIDVRLNLENP